MQAPITEKEYPVRLRWLCKYFLYSGIILLAVTAPLIANLIYQTQEKVKSPYIIAPELYQLVFVVLLLITTISLRPTMERFFFHYTVGDSFLTTQQGFLIRKKRDIPYATIQHIFVSQGVLDRILRIKTLSIENAENAGEFVSRNQRKHFKIGNLGNRTLIPGLSYTDAEALRNILLEKTKEKRFMNQKSGL